MINSFHEEYRFLSNFYLCNINYCGFVFPSLENAYQASKYGGDDVVSVYQEFTSFTPGKAKRKGQKLLYRNDWEDVKISVMETLLRIKFSQLDLMQKLLATGENILIEGNHWHDNFWGSCSCEKCGNHGQNHLGKLLMKIRSEHKI